MRVVVADTGPLNYLVLVEAIDCLSRLFGTVHVPDAVMTELRHPQAPPAVRASIEAPPDWLTLTPTTPLNPAFHPGLGLGERSAIALAQELQADLVIMDDRLGVAAAAGQGLAAVGTLRILRLAADRGLLDFAASVTRLQATNFRVRASVLRALTAGAAGP